MRLPAAHAALVAVVIAGLIAVPITPTVPTAAAARPDPVANGVHVIGDSIAAQAHRYVLTDRPASWTHDTYPGRRLTALRAPLIAPVSDRMTAIRHMFTITRPTRVSTIVVGLGTNGVAREMTAREAAGYYREAVRTLRAQPVWKPGPRRIVFVLPYTAAWLEGDPRLPGKWPSKMAVYAAGIRIVSREMLDVCVMPWRSTIAEHREYLVDGVHPSIEGLRLWKQLLFETIRRCAAPAAAY